MSPKKLKLKRKKENYLKGKDVGKYAWKDAQPNDIVFVVMGPTGVGKSTFVNHVIIDRVGANVTPPVIGDDLTSCTKDLQPFAITNGLVGQESRLVIVDTPGFDDTYIDDSVILKRIATWLASSYSKDMKLGGVVYLHDISQPRMLGTYRRNLEMFQALCGDSAAKAIVLCTTKWEGVQKAVGEKRETQLCEKFWGNMVNKGARAHRFENSGESAWGVLGLFLEPKGSPSKTESEDQVLQIQTELVELEKILPATDAGQKLRYTLQEVLDMQRDSAKALESQSGGQEYHAKLAEKKRLIESLRIQIDQLKIPFLHNLASLF